MEQRKNPNRTNMQSRQNVSSRNTASSQRPNPNLKNQRLNEEAPQMRSSNLSGSVVNKSYVKDEIPLPPQKKKKVKEKKKKNKAFKIALLVILLAILSVVVYFASVFFFYTPDSGDTSKLPFFINPGGNGNNSAVEDVKIKENTYNFLVVARDKVSGLTDVMMIINYDINNQGITVMQIPRDTYVTLNDYYYHKINGAYSYYLSGRKGEDNRELAALRDTADFLEENLCMKIHYTAFMDIDGFGKIVDAIGGVEMNVPQKMYYNDPKQNLYINLKPGYQTLDGKKAEQFVRYRAGYPDGDIGRGNAQKLFMTAFIKKLLSSISITDLDKVTNIATTVYNSIQTDLTLNDIIFFGKNFVGMGGADKVNLENVHMLTLPGEGFGYDGLSYYSLNKDATSDAVNQYFNIYTYDIKDSFDSNSVFYCEGGDKAYNKPKEELNANIYQGDQLDQSGLSK